MGEAMSTVSKEKVEDFISHAEEAVDGFEIVSKGDKRKQPLALCLLLWFLRLVGKVVPAWGRMSQGVWKWILHPEGERYEDLQNAGIYALYRHEYIHIRDMQSHPVFFLVSYFLLLPIINPFRLFWELRGYTFQMLTYYEEYGHIPQATIEGWATWLSGPKYAWTWPSYSFVLGLLEHLRNKIYSGDIKGYYINIRDFWNILPRWGIV